MFQILLKKMSLVEEYSKTAVLQRVSACVYLALFSLVQTRDYNFSPSNKTIRIGSFLAFEDNVKFKKKIQSFQTVLVRVR